jgi:hypothetical protein
MSVDEKVVLKQIDIALDLIKEARIQLWKDMPEKFKKTRNGQVFFHTLSQTEVSKLCTRLYATIERVAPRGSRHFKNAQALFSAGLLNSAAIESAEGILIALRDDYLAGYMQTIQELIHADMFSDFLDRADYLLKEGHKDAAAVIAGSVLEEHLRKLCIKNNIAITFITARGDQPKKADTMNADLARDEVVYKKIDQQAVTSWLALRNAAAHGKYSEYTKEQIVLMVQGIRNFIARHTA